MADLQHRHADARKGHQVALRLLENRDRQNGGAGGKVMNAMNGR